MTAEWFAGRLKELRERAGWTQKELAGRAGLTQAAISDLEQRRRAPLWETVLALAGALGVSTDAFAQKPAKQAPPGRGRPRKTPGDHATPPGGERRKRK
jgi:transcriptional regulator with XRE-family HTH domain